MKGSLSVVLMLGAVVGLVDFADGFARFATEIPNVGRVSHFGVVWSSLGHLQPNGPTSVPNNNPFGSDALEADSTGGDLWPKLCELDSDGDGVPNKVELCDPACAWRPGDNPPTDCRTDVFQGNEVGLPTHPGFADGDPGNGEINIAQVHGAMMIVAWLGCAPLAIMSATCFKKSDDPPFNWFKVHSRLMALASLLTIIAWVIMVGNFGLLLENVHVQIGLAVVLLAFAQPISGFLRPHKEEKGEQPKKRVYWEFGHQFLGRLLMWLAVGAVITGMEIGYGIVDIGYVLSILFGIAVLVSIVYVYRYRDVEDDFSFKKSKSFASKNHYMA